MIALLLWLILLALCPPLALLAIVIYGLFWLVLLPLKLIAAAIDALLRTLKVALTAPLRLASRKA